MAFSEFYCDPVSGSNTNGGSDAGSPSMDDSAAGTGAVSTVTHQYTSIATTGTVVVGQFISIYSGAATVPAFTSLITAVSGGSGVAWVITYSTTKKSGTEPTTGSSYKAKVGGAWKGPNAAEQFPMNFATTAMVNASGDPFKCWMKNNATYSITSGITDATTAGPRYYEGYTTTTGDGGYVVIDGGTSGASYVLYTNTSSGGELRYIKFQNNGATGTANGVSTQAYGIFYRCVFTAVRGNGISNSGAAGARLEECEAYACNQSNTSATGGMRINVAATSGGTSGMMIRCISHDNAGNQNNGFVIGGTAAQLIDCIADTNGKNGVQVTVATAQTMISGCVVYNSTSDGIDFAAAGAGTMQARVQNCRFSANGGYGINASAGAEKNITIQNCAFYNNTSGLTNNLNSSLITGSVTLTSEPSIDPANGDFRLNNVSGGGNACRGTGVGTFTQTASSYAGTVGYPDIGAPQHQDAPGTVNPFPGGQMMGF